MAIVKTGLLTAKNTNIYRNTANGAFFSKTKHGKNHHVVAMKRANGKKIRSKKGVPRKIAPAHV